MRWSIVILLLFCTTVSHAQFKAVSTDVQVSYSGYNHNATADFAFERIRLGLGLNMNYSKHAGASLPNLGFVTEVGYQVLDSTLQLAPTIRAMYIPAGEARIYEAYLGQRIGYVLNTHWRFYNMLGIGGYQETSKRYAYSLEGYSFCVSLGLQYRF